MSNNKKVNMSLLAAAAPAGMQNARIKEKMELWEKCCFSKDVMCYNRKKSKTRIRTILLPHNPTLFSYQFVLSQ